MSTDLIGQMLGPYQIIEFVGMEGAAEVFKGYHPDQNIPVLIRLVGRNLPADAVWSTRFRREAKIIAGLRHANLAPILDFGEALDSHYMVSELIEGTTLADVLAEVKAGERTLLPEDITFMVRQIAAGLDEAHGKGIVHRDVNPQRILITRSGQAILTDLGLALLLSREAEENGSDAAFGSPEYTAPEVIVDFRAASPSSDIYSVGAILYEIVTGELPFGQWSDAAAVVRTLTASAPDPRLISKNVPPAVANTIMTALAVTPRDRFKNAMQLAERLEWAYQNPTAELEKPRKNVKPADPSVRGSKVPEIPVANRPTAERVVVKRGPSLMDERREKSRLRAEHRKQQDEEKKLRAAEQRRLQAIAARAFFRRWGRTFIALILFTAIILGILYGLRSSGILRVNVVVPTVEVETGFPTRPTVVQTPTHSASSEVTLTVTASQPEAAEATPTPLDTASSTPIPPIVETPLRVGSSSLRLWDGGTMQFVPSGQFLMGTDNIQFSPNVRPQHPINLSAYWIDMTEVANAQFAQCVKSGVCKEPTKTVYYADPVYAEYPVTFIPYEQAASYCLWLAAQSGQVIGLPTEAQWEKAAAWDPDSGTQRLYPWGNEPPNADLARYVFSPDGRPASPVGSYPKGASAYGALDMAGNVWEWTADWFDPEYYQHTGLSSDPTGPLSGTERVTRGGSWRVEPNLLVVIKRNPAQPDVSGDSLGFRCAMSTERPPVDSGIVLTPLDAAQGLAGLLNQAKATANLDQAVLAEWLSALDDLKQALQSGDDATAVGLLGVRLDRLKEQQSTGQLDPSLAWRLKRSLQWVRSQIAGQAESTGTPQAGPGVTPHSIPLPSTTPTP